MTKKIVFSVPPNADRTQIYATTGQMRNFFEQFGDGYFDTLDLMNYMQHHMIAKLTRDGDHVLDMCCGRGLLLPLLRYYGKGIASYTGVDIEPANATFRTKRVHDNKPLLPGWYPFKVFFACCDVAEMTTKLPLERYNVIAYTSSIEHMHKEVGAASLHEAWKVAAPNATLALSCPVTPEGEDGYNTQYSYHVYEWKRSELEAELASVGWTIVSKFGLFANVRDLSKHLPLTLREAFLAQKEYIPNEWLVPVYSFHVPDIAREVMYICRKDKV